MAINVSPANVSGLAAIAGRRGLLNLPSPASAGLQSLQLGQQREQAAQRAALQKQQIQAQELAALRQAQIARERNALLAQQQQGQQQIARDRLGLQQQQLAQQGLLQQGQLGLQQGQLGLQERKLNIAEEQNNKKLAFEQMKLGVEQLAKKKKEDLDKIGAFATSAKLAMEQVKDPADANLLRNQIIDEAVSGKMIDKGMGEQLRKQPLSAFNRAIDVFVLQAKRAKDLKAMRNKETSSGTLKFTDSNGNTIEYNPLSKPVTTETQKSLVYAQDNLKELTGLINEVPDEFLGPKSLNQWSNTAKEWLSGVPGLNKLSPSASEKEKMKLYNSYNGKVNMLAMQTIKQLSGVQYSDKQLQFMKQIIPEIGPGTTKTIFDGKAENLVRYYQVVENAKKKLLDRGIQVSSDPNSKYGKELLQEIQNVKAPMYTPSEGFNQGQIDATIEKYKSEGWTSKEIETRLRELGAIR